MAQSAMDDSDCVIQEQNITCISIDGSDEGEIDDVEVPQQRPASNQNFEDGEVTDSDYGNTQTNIICEIKFPTKHQLSRFGSVVVSCLKEKLNEQLGVVADVVEEESQDCVKLTVKFHNFIGEIPMPPTDEKNDKFEKETSPDLSGISELFTIDTTPEPKIDSVKVPSYKRTIKDALLDEEAAELKKQSDSAFRAKKTNSCFNCGETDHNIRECPKPHNAKRIKSAKRSFQKTERYHVDSEQRFAHLKPGCISDKLREALGLRKGELPFFFYRMRVLGYPPGWLEEAKVEHSGINLFNSDGTKILNSDEDEGEVDPINHKYNISKIYDFPGFNQNPGDSFFDDYKYHNVPPFDKKQTKEEFIKNLGDNIIKGYKRKKLKDFPSQTSDESASNIIQEATDMEIEDPETTTLSEVQFTRPPPPSDQPASPPPPPPPLAASSPSSCDSPINVSETGERSLSTQSPSLLELEKQKQRLLQELQSNTTIIEIEDSLIDEILELDEDNDKKGDPLLNTENRTAESTEVVANEKSDDNNDSIKQSFMGTPVLQFSLYSNLPNGENFKVGVSDVINFENLPDSTGKYEQMKEVLKKVRNCVQKLQSEE